jgi:hypothetical protein
MPDKPYGEQVLDTMRKQCDRRGIPPEEFDDSVLAFVREKYGKPIHDMDVPELKRLNRNLQALFVEYLDGKKRRGDEDALVAW